MNERSENMKLKKAYDNLLMISMFSVVMLFAGLTSAYIVSMKGLGAKWDLISLPTMFYLSTLMIMTSSYFAQSSIKYCKNNNLALLSKGLLITIFFGFLFFLFQILGWSSLVNENKFLSGNNVSASFLYILTGLHFVHVIGGMISLVFMYVKSLQYKYTSKSFHGLQLGVRFWHFLGLLWIYLFLFLVLIKFLVNI